MSKFKTLKSGRVKKRSKLLLVDDTPENIDILTEVLAEYKCYIALNGRTALKIAASKNKPDLILLDIMMPDMDGYEVCRQLKLKKSTKDIPVIFLTSKTQVEDEIKGFELGSVDYITKPFSPPIVKVRVKNHLELGFTRKKLEKQNKELIKAGKLRDEVEQITRHDLKSPLTVIIATSQMLCAMEHIDNDTKTSITSIEKAGYRILEMVDRSLDLLKMEKGIYKVEMQPVDVLQIINKIKQDTSLICTKNRISIDIFVNGKNISNNKFVINGESLLFYSMLSNLIKNAIEASPVEKHITINLLREKYLTIKIHNYGTVPLNIRDTFFDKYVTYGKKDGTGLGTYSAKLIAKNLNGSIQMNSSEAEGTIITITFPKSI